MENLKQYIVFNMENEDYGIELADVYEINRLREINIIEFPKAPQFVEGIINLRGEVVPVIDLRKRFKLPEKEITKDSRVIIVKFEKKTIGLIVDNVTKTVEFYENELANPPDGLRDVNSKYIKAVGQSEGEIVTILNVKEILNIVEEIG